MPSSTSLRIKDILVHFPDIKFQVGHKHSWDSHHKIITYTESDTIDSIHGLLHEICHAILGHSEFKHDIELLKMERDAWDKAIEIAKSQFGLELSRDHAEDCLDSYRDWLYKRSSCPRCRLVGYQIERNAYSCPYCLIDWQVPASRLCSVKRKILAKSE